MVIVVSDVMKAKNLCNITDYTSAYQNKGCERVIGVFGLEWMGICICKEEGKEKVKLCTKVFGGGLVFIRCGAGWLLLSNAFSLTYRRYGLSAAAFADDATVRHETVAS